MEKIIAYSVLVIVWMWIICDAYGWRNVGRLLALHINKAKRETRRKASAYLNETRRALQFRETTNQRLTRYGEAVD